MDLHPSSGLAERKRQVWATMDCPYIEARTCFRRTLRLAGSRNDWDTVPDHWSVVFSVRLATLSRSSRFRVNEKFATMPLRKRG